MVGEMIDALSILTQKKGVGMCFFKKNKHSLISIVLLFSLLFSAILLTSCSSEFKSPDGRFEERLVNNSGGTNYEVIETKTGKSVFTTFAEYDTPNDVKSGKFSPDSKKFAAAYHYSHDGNYTWIGVWSTETGKFLYSKRIDGWTTDLDEAFNN